MLMDEPETGLDQESIPLLWGIIQEEMGQKRTVILTTHNLERGLELGDRVLILDRGKIVYDCVRKVLSLDSLKEAYRASTRVSV